MGEDDPVGGIDIEWLSLCVVEASSSRVTD
jgi:hypothetical protein